MTGYSCGWPRRGGRGCPPRGDGCGEKRSRRSQIVPCPSLPESIALRREPPTLKEICVDRSPFDALTRRVSHQTTRRAALTTLIGGALLLQSPADGDGADAAADEAR